MVHKAMKIKVIIKEERVDRDMKYWDDYMQEHY